MKPAAGVEAVLIVSCLALLVAARALPPGLRLTGIARWSRHALALLAVFLAVWLEWPALAAGASPVDGRPEHAWVAPPPLLLPVFALPVCLFHLRGQE